MHKRFLSLADGYKLSHRADYPPGTQRVYSNWTPRGSRIEGVNEAVAFGLQAVLQENFGTVAAEFFATPRGEVIDRWRRDNAAYLGPDEADQVGAQHISDLHDLGYLPLRVCGLPEGTVAPLRIPQWVIENTLDEFFWLTNWVETLLSTESWLPTTSATSAWHFRRMLEQHCAATGGNPEFIPFQGHDFSMRGMQSIEAGAASGAGHLLSFVGSDTRSAIDWIEEFYDTDRDELVIAVSVPATEHSVMCAGGKPNELETYRRILTSRPTGIVSIVSDTWDLWHVLTSILPELKPEVMAREGTAVIRPDSGDPEDILLGARGHDGRPASAPGSPAWRGVLDLLGHTFGTTTNDAGYKSLDPHVGAIYGDAITYDRGDRILRRQAEQGWASTIEVFGLGSYHYGYVTRDTLGFAVKATQATVNGVDHDLHKDPVTDPGVKKSATGRLAVIRDSGQLRLIEQASIELEQASLLQPVWENGKFLRRQTFADARSTLWPNAAA